METNLSTWSLRGNFWVALNDVIIIVADAMVPNRRQTIRTSLCWLACDLDTRVLISNQVSSNYTTAIQRQRREVILSGTHVLYFLCENTVTLRARNIKQHSKILCTFYGLILYDFDDSLVVRAYNVSAEVVYYGCTISKWFISLYDYVMTLKRSPCVCYCPLVWFTGSFPSLRNFVAHVVVSLNPPQSVFTYVQYYP